MTKVQLQSKDALPNLHLRFQQAIEHYAAGQTNWSPAQREKFRQHLALVAEEAFASLKANVQINGKEWEEFDDAMDAVEPIDASLADSLLALQIEVNELLVEVTGYRSDLPSKVASAIAENLSSATSESPQFERPVVDASLQVEAISEDERAQLRQKMETTATLLSQLTKGLPDMVSRLQQESAGMD